MANERRRWTMAAGAVAAMVLGGAVVVLGAPPAAEAQQTPQDTRVFNRVCGRCHPDGGEDTGPDLHNKRLTEARMTEVIRQGTKRMRPITPTKLTDADLPRVMNYLRAIHAVR